MRHQKPKIMQRKTILQIEVTNNDFNIKYSGVIDKEPTEKDDLKHDQRLMRMLASNKKVFNFFFRIVEPARRFYVREAKKKETKKKSTIHPTNPLTH